MVTRNVYRFILRNDTEEQWERNKDFVPLRGEPIVVFDQFGNARIKIGDGIRNYGDLGFIDGIMRAQLPPLPLANGSDREIDGEQNVSGDTIDADEYIRVALGG